MLETIPLQDSPRSTRIAREQCYSEYSTKWLKVDRIGTILERVRARSYEDAINLVLLLQNQQRYLQIVEDSVTIEKFHLTKNQIMELVALTFEKMQFKNIFSYSALFTLDDPIYFVETGFVKKNHDPIQLPSNLADYSEKESEVKYEENTVIDIRMGKRRFNCRPIPYSNKFSIIADTIQKVLMDTYLGNIEDIVLTTLSDELAGLKDSRAVQIARRYASTGGSVKIKSFHDIIVASGNMYRTSQRGEINIVIGGVEVIAMLRKDPRWVNDSTQSRAGTLVFVGMIAGIKVYSSRGQLLPDEALLVYKNPDAEGDIALAFGEQRMFALTLDYPETTQKLPIGSIEDHMLIQKGFILHGRVVLSKNNIFNSILKFVKRVQSKYAIWKWSRNLDKENSKST